MELAGVEQETDGLWLKGAEKKSLSGESGREFPMAILLGQAGDVLGAGNHGRLLASSRLNNQGNGIGSWSYGWHKPG